MDKNYVKIFDTTLRDGEQAPGNSMNLSEKLRLARQLERLGVDVLEAGFPIASPDDFEAVKTIAGTCPKMEICGLARAVEKDITAAWEAVKEANKPRIHTFIATSPVHMEFKLKKTPEEVLKMAVAAVKLCKSYCDRVDFSPEDAVRSEPKFLYEVLQAVIEAGADTINIPDTVGYATPEEFGRLIAGIIANVPNIEGVIVSTHCHDDLGLAVANSLAGVKNGARQIECTINGIGERAGNASLEECVMALQTRKDFYHLKHGIKTKELYPTSRLLTSITGVPVQPNKAIVGANAFAHEAGIHQDGVLKKRSTYEIMRAQDVGLESNAIVLGKHSGRHALKDRLIKLGYELEDEELNEVYIRFTELADKKKKVFDEDLILLIKKENPQDQFKLKDLFVTAGTTQKPWAEVVVFDPEGRELQASAEGTGPVDAAYQAVNEIIKVENTLLEYTVSAVTQGIDSQAVVAIQISKDGHIFSGSSGETDIVVASTKAYLEALNRAIRYKRY